MGWGIFSRPCNCCHRRFTGDAVNTARRRRVDRFSGGMPVAGSVDGPFDSEVLLMNTKPLLAAVIAGTLTLSACATDSHRSAGQVIGDQVIETRVKAALIDSPA